MIKHGPGKNECNLVRDINEHLINVHRPQPTKLCMHMNMEHEAELALCMRCWNHLYQAQNMVLKF